MFLANYHATRLSCYVSSSCASNISRTRSGESGATCCGKERSEVGRIVGVVSFSQRSSYTSLMTSHRGI